MVAIAAGVIVGWPGTVASIPSGWSRVTALDSKHLRGSANGVDPGGTGGADTHSHTTQSHTHTESSPHTHTIPTSPAAATTVSTDAGSLGSPDAHTHASNPATGAPSGAISAASPATSSDNNEPQRYDVIWLESDGTPAGLPANCVAYWNDGAGAPTGWGFCDGTAGTIDTRNLYLKGAAAGLGGGATGGATTHLHNIAAHNHGDWAHTHAQVTSGTAGGTATGGSVSGPARTPAATGHTHTLDAASATATVTVNTNANSGTSSNDPPYVNLAVVRNTSGADSIPDSVICLWTGTLASIPAGWALCDGTGGTPDQRTKYAKCPNTIGGVGGTGGSLTSAHTSASHDHSVASHQHTLTLGAPGTAACTGGTANTPSDSAHTHTGWQANAQTSSWGSTAVTVDNNTSVQPAYYDVAFIQKTAGTNGTLTAGAITVLGSVAASTLSGGASFSAGLAPAAFTMPTATLSGGALLSAGLAPAAFTMPTAQIFGGTDGTLTAGALTFAASVASAIMSGGASMAASLLALVASVPGASLVGSTAATAGKVGRVAMRLLSRGGM